MIQIEENAYQQEAFHPMKQIEQQTAATRTQTHYNGGAVISNTARANPARQQGSSRTQENKSKDEADGTAAVTRMQSNFSGGTIASSITRANPARQHVSSRT